MTNETKTTVYLHPTITACLAKAEQALGVGQWVDTNLGQYELVNKLPELRALLADMPRGLMEAIGSDDADIINDWLADRGYQIKLNQFKPEEFGVAAALDVLAKWKIPGTPTFISHNPARLERLPPVGRPGRGLVQRRVRRRHEPLPSLSRGHRGHGRRACTQRAAGGQLVHQPCWQVWRLSGGSPSSLG